MSPRTKKIRSIQRRPNFAGFKPYGSQTTAASEVPLSFAEYEAIKLCDYEILTHAEASAIMNVSRPTFTRIYESARRKIAKAFVEGGTISFEVDESIVNTIWYTCQSCKITFSVTENSSHTCPFCHSTSTSENK
jgi:predicted DNA-binding protein (UPF0251 family)